ncbi:hypothetical protein HPB47_006930 [Ixodes persulcatus]|uniref:Uncharacterized protein n=1 Tax=Ixodes persulcatus TaxID=34615 RepID=A0AC60P9F0_IXOPE|nr:hypothetical protein HPB47_006930 [Ixodes persulcatus]
MPVKDGARDLSVLVQRHASLAAQRNLFDGLLERRPTAAGVVEPRCAGSTREALLSLRDPRLPIKRHTRPAEQQLRPLSLFCVLASVYGLPHGLPPLSLRSQATAAKLSLMKDSSYWRMERGMFLSFH